MIKAEHIVAVLVLTFITFRIIPTARHRISHAACAAGESLIRLSLSRQGVRSLESPLYLAY